MSRRLEISDVTVLIPIHRRKGNREWLAQAIGSLPEEAPKLVLENRGDVSGALNRGLAQAETEFVLPFGSDDLVAPMFIDYLLGPAWNADVVYPSMRILNETLDEQLGFSAAEAFCGLRLQENNYIPAASLIRREQALAVGGFRRMDALEDWDLWVRMHRAGCRFKPCPEAQLLYRFRAGSRNDQVKTPEILADYRDRIVRGKGFGFSSRFRRVGPDPLDEVQATFYNAATPATTYLRCQLPARHLPGVVRAGIAVAHNDTKFAFPEHFGKAAVLQLAADKERALMALLMREKGIRVLVESDDNYLVDPGRGIRERAQWGKRIGEQANSVQGHAAIVKDADGVIVTTEVLANQYRELNPNVHVCPNTVDPQDWPEPEKPEDGILRIVWFASLSHQADAPLVTPAFEWAARQPGVQVYAAGFNPGWRFPHGYLPWLDDLDAYRESFRFFDIGVAPIKHHPFALGRSDVKALEYAMGLCTPVLSDVAPYKTWTHGETCLKAGGAKEFRRAIEHLVRHPDEARQLAAAAREYVLAERTTAAQIHHWQEAING